jgi:pimeloyl-ACP methyl ester carboxylesterase
MLTSALATVAFVLLAAGTASADVTATLKISKSCREFLHRKMLGDPAAQLVLGQFYVAQDAPTGPSACAWHASSPYGAFAACTRDAQKRNVAAPCLPFVKDGQVVARSYAEARTRAGTNAWELTMASDPWRCGQEPGSRPSWLEHGFCDVNVHGPEKARGVVIWNHGLLRSVVQYTAPPALAMRLLHANGWDVVKINRNNLGEGPDSYRRGEIRTEEEIKAQRARGYRRIVLAGQSFGGRVALELATIPEVFASIAFAPGTETTVGNSRTQAPTDDRLRRATVERLAVVFPAGDELLGTVERGRTAGPVLAARGRPYLMLDETAPLTGHSGGTGGNFAFRYGRCLEQFISADTVAAGRVECAPGGWQVARALLPSIPPDVRIADGTGDVPGGLWYGLVGEHIIAFAVVEAGSARRSVLFAWVASASIRGGGVYDATMEGGVLTSVLPNKVVLTVKRRDARTLDVTWTPPPAETNFGIVARRADPLQGELIPVE